MIRSNAVVAIVLGVAVAACQRAPEPAAAPPSTSAPVSQATVAPGPTPVPADIAVAAPPTDVGPSKEANSAAVAPRSAPRPAPRAASRTRTADRTAPRRSDRVERVDRLPAPEPNDLPAETGRRDVDSAPAREPNRDRLVIPAGTELQLVLETALSSATSQEGDPVTARVSRATGPDGNVLLPGGTVLKGRVYRADAAGRVKGRSRLGVDFDRIIVRGEEHRLDTTAIEVEGPDSHGRDAAIIGGSTVGGAIVGGILGGGKGAKKGAVVGVLGGTGAVLATKGKDVEIPSGSHWTVRVKTRVAAS